LSDDPKPSRIHERHHDPFSGERDMSEKEQDEGSGSGHGRWIRGALVAFLVVGGLILLGRAAGQHVVGFVEWVDGLGSLAPLLFILGYAVATVAFIPGSVLTLAAGAVFGIVQGVAWVFVGALLGSTAAFLVGRYVARDWVERRIGGDVRFEALDRSIGRQGLKLVVLLRLTPVMPYNLLNYALGLTRVRLSQYVVGAFGMLPGTLLYVYSGRVAGDIAAAAGGAAVPRGAGYYAVLVLGLLATLGLTIIVTRMARAALSQEVGSPEPSGD
jgi:uncharacterized membrane protein YdjX (TVP38/TMEM64 family)